MELILSTSHPWSANWSTKEGKVVYKTQCPAAAEPTITIEKAFPAAEGEEETFKAVGKIKIRGTYDSEVTIKGSPRRITAEILRKGERNSGKYGLRDQYVTGPDGREYLWKILEKKVELVLCDEAKTPVIKYHRHHATLPWQDPKPARLEIFQGGREIVDFIVITFILVEKLRVAAYIQEQKRQMGR
ncbi:hypothetical protein DFP72DRAFT_887358 [Ephemerocybe angulata]|uniref:DUF6593 domain-containing protein n=1 Tax=Ephemerocybe angulata TaxID=980116 RepID=A0A8H6I4J4_9AGAR|nr:hypothetical protein DFP72DRAFT_889103 [Tulosesus angulatus]KAF6758499.1 hypothetical protein DFP72DRAFT_887358 [Tulosesus angulatus]